MNNHLLSRYAEAVYWLARYVERTENLARVLDVNETFSRDSRGGQNWLSILQLYRDEERFAESELELTGENVLYFYVLDPSNPSSIVSSIKMARDNARTLRPLISTEMWIQLNILYNHLRAMTRANLAEPRIARLCAFIKEACQTHTGITEGTFYRDEGWYFYQLGRWIERADQTTRLLDVKYHLLLPKSENIGSPLDISQWNSVLRSAAGYHAFRRVHPSGMTPTGVAGFLLFHKRFPRSVLACINELEHLLHEMKSTYGLKRGLGALEQLDNLRGGLANQTADSVIESGLHEFLDWLQLTLIAVHGELGRDYFGYEEAS